MWYSFEFICSRYHSQRHKNAWTDHALPRYRQTPVLHAQVSPRNAQTLTVCSCKTGFEIGDFGSSLQANAYVFCQCHFYEVTADEYISIAKLRKINEMQMLIPKQICVFDNEFSNEFSNAIHKTFCNHVLLYGNKSLTLHY